MSESNIQERFAVKLPDAIIRQKEELAAMMRAASGEQPGAQQPPSAPAGGQEATEGVEGAGEQPQPAGAQQAAPSTTPAPAEPKEPAKELAKDSTQNSTQDSTQDSSQDDESVDALRRRLAEAIQEAKTWKGRERKERETVESLQARIADLEARLSKAMEAAPPPEPEPAAPSEEEIDLYGKDLLDMAKRYTLADLSARIEAALAPLVARLEALESGVQRVTAKEAKSDWEKFLDRLRKEVPDYETIDASDEFKDWLDLVDPVFGEPNRKGLEAACRSMDSARAIAVFKRFQQQTGKRGGGSRGSTAAVGSSTTGTGQPQAQAATAPQEAAPRLEDLAAPGRPAASPSAPALTSPGGKVWTLAEIESYYRERGSGRHPHSFDPRKAAEMDAEIVLAQREGRVRM